MHTGLPLFFAEQHFDVGDAQLCALHFDQCAFGRPTTRDLDRGSRYPQQLGQKHTSAALA